MLFIDCSIYTDVILPLLNCIGFQHVSPVETFPTAKWEQMIGLMLTSPFLLVQKFLPEMKRKGYKLCSKSLTLLKYAYFVIIASAVSKINTH